MGARMASRRVGVLALVLGLAGCGSDDNGGDARHTPVTTQRSGTELVQPAPKGPIPGRVQRSAQSALPPEAQVDRAIKGVLASGVPGLACDRHATARFVRTAFGSRAGCRRSTVPASAARSVSVREIDVRGRTASAKAVPDGGPSDGETIWIRLVRAGGVWKVDALRSNAPVGP